MTRTTRWRLAAAVALTLLAGCGKEDAPPQGAQTAPETPAADAQPAPASAQAPIAPPSAAADTATAEPGLPPESPLAQYAQAGLPDTLIKDGCYSCHDVNGARIGPPLRAVAGLYRTDPQAVDKLTQKVLHGGGGVWGPTPMIAHPQLSAEQVRPMIEAILKLN